MADVVERYGSDWISRLQRDANGKGENVVLVNQRLSSTDLAGQLINRSLKGHAWQVVHIPVTHPADPSDVLKAYPDHWRILQLRGGQPGSPTSSRIDLKTVEERRAAMSPAAFTALFMGDVRTDRTLSPFKDDYLRELPSSDLSVGATVLALDLALTGKGDGHGYAVVGAGSYGCKGKAVIVEAGELVGAVDDLVPQIVELVKRNRVTSVACERAGGGFVLMRSLNQGLTNFGVNVEAIHHGNRSKWQRLEQELGGMALGNVLVPTASAWLPKIREQFKAIATRHGSSKDDVADACLYGLEVVGRWIRGGFSVNNAEWGRQGMFFAKPAEHATWGFGTEPISRERSQYQYPTDRDMPCTWDNLTSKNIRL